MDSIFFITSYLYSFIKKKAIELKKSNKGECKISLPAWFFSFGWVIGPAMILIGIIGIMIQIAILVWVHNDAKRRNMEAAIWLLIVIIFNLLGVIIYLLVRNPIASQRDTQYVSSETPANIYETNPSPQYNASIPKQQGVKICMNCSTQVSLDGRFCPNCGNSI